MSGSAVRDLIAAIQEHRAELSEIDGAIGDGDHGVNMAKGFGGCAVRLDQLGPSARRLPVALEELGHALMDDIGGSMGPLYGRFFLDFAAVLRPHQVLDASLFAEALAAALAGVQGMGNAKVGDKTLLDALVPALNAYRDALGAGATFAACLQALHTAAQQGRDATRDMQARIGRAARLGARSIGVLDAGAASCCLILQTLAESLQRQMASRPAG